MFLGLTEEISPAGYVEGPGAVAGSFTNMKVAPSRSSRRPWNPDGSSEAVLRTIEEEIRLRAETAKGKRDDGPDTGPSAKSGRSGESSPDSK